MAWQRQPPFPSYRYPQLKNSEFLARAAVNKDSREQLIPRDSRPPAGDIFLHCRDFMIIMFILS
jgi:hypothetical protein